MFFFFFVPLKIAWDVKSSVKGEAAVSSGAAVGAAITTTTSSVDRDKPVTTTTGNGRVHYIFTHHLYHHFDSQRPSASGVGFLS